MEDAAADTATHEPATHDPADPVTDEHVSDEVDPEPSEPARAVPMRVTPDALSQVMSILAAEDDPESLGLRIAVTGVQGVEYAYDLSFEDRTSASDDDLVYNQGDLVVMIPRDSVDALWGATLDLPSTAGQGGLVIRNPNRPDPLADFDIELTGTVEERIDQLLAVNGEVEGECQGRVQQSFVTHARPTAVLGQAFSVQEQQCLLADPAPAHLANW